MFPVLALCTGFAPFSLTGCFNLLAYKQVQQNVSSQLT